MKEARNILAASTPGSEPGAYCGITHNPADNSNRVIISYRQSIEDYLADHARDTNGQFVLLSIGESIRSSAATAGISPSNTPTPTEPRVIGIEDPTNLTEIGITLLEQFQKLDSTNQETLLCFDSLNTFLDTVPLNRGFRFLQIIAAMVRKFDVTAHYHYDADIDDKTFKTIQVLFDEELSTGPDRATPPSEYTEE